MRRARGLEAALVDNDIMEIAALGTLDSRRTIGRVAGPAALVVAKAHKIAEREQSAPHRLVDKDAHDIYRVLLGTDTEVLASTFRMLQHEAVCAEVTVEALSHLRKMFAAGPDALGSMMAGRAEEGVGEPETVALQVSILADDLLKAIGKTAG
jgi:hypothetical protein